MIRTLGAIGPIALILAACTPAADTTGNGAAVQPADNAAAENAPGNDVAGNMTGNEAAPVRSILRPEIVAPEPEPPALEPLDRVIPFPQPGHQLDDEGRKLLDSLLTDPIMRAGGAITLSGPFGQQGRGSRQSARLAPAGRGGARLSGREGRRPDTDHRRRARRDASPGAERPSGWHGRSCRPCA